MPSIKFKITFENNYYVVEIESLNIICYNKTIKGLFTDLYEELNVLWKEFALCDDSKLDITGIELKNKLISLKDYH